jgi:hypothetical protein
MSAVSLQVWHALKRPPIHHPLFRRVSQAQVHTPQWQLSQPQRIAMFVLLGITAYFCLRYFSQMILVLLFVAPLTITALYMALHGTVAGLFWAIRVSSAIARERERGIFELLSASPYGSFSVSWAICTGCQYYDQMFNGVGAQRVWFSRIFFLSLLLFCALLTLADPRSTAFIGNPLWGIIISVEITLVTAFAFHIDDIHSTVIGSLVGVIVPIFARSRLDARAAAFGLFLLLQIGTYAAVWLVGFMLMPQLNARLNVGFFGEIVLLPVEQLIVFFAVREGFARLLWAVNRLLLAGDVSDLRLLTKGGRLIC